MPPSSISAEPAPAAPARPTNATLPAAASSATLPLINGPARSGRVLGLTASGAWIGVARPCAPDACLVLTADRHARLPNALILPGPLQALGQLAPGHDVRLGHGRIDLGPIALRPARWWDPHPTLAPTHPRTLAHRLRAIDAPPPLPLDAASAFHNALTGRHPTAALPPARDLLGRGPGLTPLGDDVLTAALAALRLIGPTLPHPLAAHARALHHALAAAILPLAPARTTLLSASLLHHAAAGEVAAPLAGFLHTLTGRGDPLHTLPPLLDVGHTSGAGLAAGALAAAHALTATEQAP